MDNGRRQRLAVILGDIGIDLGNGFDDAVEVEIDKARLAGAGLDLGNAQQRIEGLVDLQAFGARLRQLVGNGLAPRGLVGGAFQDHLQPVERRLQIMRDVGADLAHAVDQGRQPLERGVDLARDAVDVVAIAEQRNAGVEPAVARHRPWWRQCRRGGAARATPARRRRPPPAPK